jgi:transcriptional regulator with XRE-family HTH domain
MGEVARHLGVSVTYVSDVERCIRAPFTSDRLREAATFVGANLERLLEAAAVSRGAFELDASNVSATAREVGGMLMRDWTELDDDKLEQIKKVLGR